MPLALDSTYTNVFYDHVIKVLKSKIQAEFGSFSNYQWRFVNGSTQQNSIAGPADYRATSPESDAMSKDLKKRGFKFVGSTIIYAHMQACGMVNDHHNDCFRKHG